MTLVICTCNHNIAASGSPGDTETCQSAILSLAIKREQSAVQFTFAFYFQRCIRLMFAACHIRYLLFGLIANTVDS